MRTASALKKWVFVSLACGSLGVALPGLAFAAGNGLKQVKIAEQHAGFAVKARKIKLVHAHLHHVLNCLVGPNGEGYDAAQLDPCKGLGNGAINDFTGPAEKKALLEQAVGLAKTGVEISAYAPAHDVAMAVRDLLQETARGGAKRGM